MADDDRSGAAIHIPAPPRNKMAPGFRFRPELREVIYYLQNWVSGKEIPVGVDIKVCDLYGEEEPWEMWSRWCGGGAGEDDAEEEVYVFSRLKWKGRGGAKKARTTGRCPSARWHSEGKKEFTVEMDGGRSVLCLVRSYSYRNENLNPDDEIGWGLTEFSCPDLSKNHVICEMRRKSKSKSKSVIKLEVAEETEMMEVVPPGFRFKPTHEELVGYYLFDRISQKESPFANRVIRECDLYGEEEPWRVWDRFVSNDNSTTEKDLYFFTRQKKMRPEDESSRKVRKIGLGTWHEEGADWEGEVRIKIGQELRVLRGMRRRLKYKNSNSCQDCKWIMFEYSSPSLSSELALCVLRNNGGGGDGGVTVTLCRNEAVSSGEELADITTTRDFLRLIGGDEAPSSVRDRTEGRVPNLRRFRDEGVPANWLSLGIGTGRSFTAGEIVRPTQNKRKYY